MCKKAKEFESESFSDSSSFFKWNKNNIQSENQSLDLVKMQISDEYLNKDEEDNKEKYYKENIINENNNNQEQFNILDDNQNNNSNNNNINNFISQENEIAKNFDNIQNLEMQNMNKIDQKYINVPQPQSMPNKSTGEMTNIKIIFEESPSKIEIKKEEEEKEDKKIEDNNKKDDKKNNIKNYYPEYIKRFFKDLVIFINRLIEKFNKENHTNISGLQLINGNKYYHSNLKNALYLLDRTVMQALSTRVEFVKGEDNKEKEVIENLANFDICSSIYNETDEKNRINKVIEVFNKTIRELMTIYNEYKHEDELYKYFNTFGEYVNTVSDEKKEILIDIGKNYESIITKKINENEHKRGPKPKLKKKK